MPEMWVVVAMGGLGARGVDGVETDMGQKRSAGVGGGGAFFKGVDGYK